MQVQSMIANPFAMLLDLDAVVREVECSERLNRLHSRIYRPLDKPLIPVSGSDVADYDRMIEATTVDLELSLDDEVVTAQEVKASAVIPALA